MGSKRLTTARQCGGKRWRPGEREVSSNEAQSRLEPAGMSTPGATPVGFSVPLHVDCSVEYELPECAKPPQGVTVEPLLMIHPCHFRNLERQKRRPFENNLPRRRTGHGWEPYRTARQAPPSLPPEPPYLPPPPEMLLGLPYYEAV